MTRLPDRSRSRAVLIGVGRYRNHGALPDIPAVWANLTDLERVLTDPETGTFDRAECAVVADPDSPLEVAAAVAAAADGATDVLLIYVCGHGMVDKSGRAYLAVASTDPERLETSAFSLEVLRRVIESGRATNRILLLDSCQSASSTAPGIGRWLATSLRGVSVLSSNTSADEHPVSTHTAFTAALLAALTTTEPATIDLISHRIQRKLLSGGLPEPQYWTGSAPDVALCRAAGPLPADRHAAAVNLWRQRWQELFGAQTKPSLPHRAGIDPAAMNNQAIDLLERYNLTGGAESLYAAAVLLRQAVVATDSEAPEYLSNLASALHQLFERTGALTVLEEAIQLSRTSVGATPRTDPSHAGRLSNLGSALQRLHERTGEIEPLREAVTVGREAVAATALSDHNRAGYLSNLSSALRRLHETTGDPTVLDEAITASRDAVKCGAATDSATGLYLNNLGIGLLTSHDRNDSPQLLEEALTAFRHAVDATPTGHQDRASRLNNLAAALLRKHSKDTDAQALQQAIHAMREAVGATGTEHPDRAKYLSNLGMALRISYGQAGDARLLDEAVECARAAIDATPKDHPEFATHVYRLGQALRLRSAQGPR
ncbi:tetratricopeptide repeat protein [Nocardia brasiliensis]|uniref:caspase, EACC1-associated type n=1 Tax=Nocardia brasiliensis TaxID=37326 RepID=UPI00378AFE2D